MRFKLFSGIYGGLEAGGLYSLDIKDSKVGVKARVEQLEAGSRCTDGGGENGLPQCLGSAVWLDVPHAVSSCRRVLEVKKG